MVTNYRLDIVLDDTQPVSRKYYNHYGVHTADIHTNAPGTPSLHHRERKKMLICTNEYGTCTGFSPPSARKEEIKYVVQHSRNA